MIQLKSAEQIEAPLVPEGRYSIEALLERVKPWQSDLQVVCEEGLPSELSQALEKLAPPQLHEIQPKDLASLTAFSQASGIMAEPAKLIPRYYAPGV